MSGKGNRTSDKKRNKDKNLSYNGPSYKIDHYQKVLRGAGQPQRYTDPNDLIEGALDYFEQCIDNPISATRPRPFLNQSLCLQLGICQTTWKNYRKDPRLADACEMIDMILQEQVITGAMTEDFNPHLTSRYIGLVDKTENNHSFDKFDEFVHKISENGGDLEGKRGQVPDDA